MGYPTRRVKVRRHNRNLRLHAMVALSGAELKTHLTWPARSWRGPRTRMLAFFVQFHSPELAGNTRFTLNPVRALEDAAAVLGLENV